MINLDKYGDQAALIGPALALIRSTPESGRREFHPNVVKLRLIRG
jgi:hypothetical protein